jgi:hypothetical protein
LFEVEAGYTVASSKSIWVEMMLGRMLSHTCYESC